MIEKTIWKTDKSNYIAGDFCPGKNFTIGSNNIILPDVRVGDNVEVGHFTLIKSNTEIKDNVFFDSYCLTSGDCFIGEGSKIRYQSIIARGVEIGKDVFFCAGVKTAYLNHKRGVSLKTLIIKDGCFIGDNATILSGLTLAEGVVIGAHSLVTKDCDIPHGVYMGTPAKFVRTLTEKEMIQTMWNEAAQTKAEKKNE